MDDDLPQLPPATTPAPPPRPHPIDAALAALSEAVSDLLVSDRSSRFGEINSLTTIAMHLQRLRPGVGVDDVDPREDEFGDIVAHRPVMMQRRRNPAPAFNDGADLNREIIMLAQTFLAQYVEAEKKKADKPDPDVRLDEVTELAELFGLRLKLAVADQDIPPEINARIAHLLTRIGEPPHEPAPDPVVFAEHVRRREADGPGEPDGGGVGEALAE